MPGSTNDGYVARVQAAEAPTALVVEKVGITKFDPNIDPQNVGKAVGELYKTLMTAILET